MKKYIIGACGNFDLDPLFLNGQIIRTCSIMDQLEKEIGKERIRRLSYASWKKHPIKTILKYYSLFAHCENVILFPDLRAIFVLIPLACLFKKITKSKVYYNVIGGWLPEFLGEHVFIRRCTKSLDGLFVQTNQLAEQLRIIGITRTTVFPNFKDIKIYSIEEKPEAYTKPLSLVFMSRITGRKGVKELVSTINKINTEKIKYTLDIYGSVQDDFKEDFDQLKDSFGKAITYKGQVDPLKTSSVMKDYFLHIFPTTFKTEGYPGSVLDALAAGVPTLSARWLSYNDVLDEGKTGMSFTLGNWQEMEETLENIYDNPEKVWKMREDCISEAEKYRPEKIIKIIIDKLQL